MYIRSTEIQSEPARIDAGLRLVHEEIFPEVSAIDGCVGMSMLVDRQTGRCVTTTAWSSEDTMQASAASVRTLRDRAERALGSTSGRYVHEWEAAVVHRDHATPDDACARLTWLSCDPTIVESAIDTFRMAVMPQVQALIGFCSASLMVDREHGRVVSTVAFDNRDAAAASRAISDGIRERVAGELGATVDKVEELEVAFAHLHVPEMA